MSKLVVDETSAKTLPLLDKIYAEDPDKFASIIARTTGAPLRRLALASIARQTIPGFPMDSRLSNTSKLVELLIHNNLLSVPGDKNEQEASDVMDALDEASMQFVLSASMTRYHLFSGIFAQNAE